MDARPIHGTLDTGMTTNSVYVHCYRLPHSCHVLDVMGSPAFLDVCLHPLRSPPAPRSCGARGCPGELGTRLRHRSTLCTCRLAGDTVPTAVSGTFKLPVFLRWLFAYISG